MIILLTTYPEVCQAQGQHCVCICLALVHASLVAQTVKASAYNAGDLGSIPGSGRSPGEGNDNPLQNSCLENAMDWRRSLVGYSPWGRKESDTTEPLHFHFFSLWDTISQKKMQSLEMVLNLSRVILGVSGFQTLVCLTLSSRSSGSAWEGN